MAEKFGRDANETNRLRGELSALREGVRLRVPTRETLAATIEGVWGGGCGRMAPACALADAVLALITGPAAPPAPTETEAPSPLPEGIRFSDFVKAHGLRIETFATCDLSRGGAPARGAHLRLGDKHCEVREGCGLRGAFSVGATDEQAIAALPAVYAGKALRFGARVGHHSETDPECVKIQCPATWEQEPAATLIEHQCPINDQQATPAPWDEEDQRLATGATGPTLESLDARLKALKSAARLERLARHAEFSEAKGYARGVAEGAKIRLDGHDSQLAAVTERLGELDARLREVELQVRVSDRLLNEYCVELNHVGAKAFLATKERIEREERERGEQPR